MVRRWNSRQTARTHGGRCVLLLAATVLLGITACDADPAPKRATDTGTLTAPTNTAPRTSERDAVVAAYKKFWVVLQTLNEKPEGRWDERLAKVAVNPQLKISLQAARFQALNGERTYGEVRARISDVKLDGATAKVTDCQDASHSGVADAKTGEHKTVGIARNPVDARLKRHDGTWKVADINYPGGEC